MSDNTDNQRHPHDKPQVEQPILDSKAALATSPDKEAQQQAYPQAQAHDTAQESLDNPTELQEEQPVEDAQPAPAAAAAPGDGQPAPDASPAARQATAETQASIDLATASKESLKGEPPVITQPAEADKQQAKKLDFGKAGKLKVESVGQRHYGVAGPEYTVTLRLADDRTYVLHNVPADLLS